MKTNNKKKIVVSTLALAMGAALAGSVSGSVAWYQYSTRSVAEFTGVAAHCTENLQIRVKEDSASYVMYDEAAAKIFTYTTSTKTWDAGETIPAARQYANKTAAEEGRDAGSPTIERGQYCLIDGKPFKLVEDTPKDSFESVLSVANEAGRKGFVQNFDWNSDLRSEAIEQYLTFVGRSTANELVPVTAKAGFDGNRAVAEHLYREPVYQEANVLREADDNDYISLPLEIRVLDNDGTESKKLAQDIHVTDVAMEAVRGSTDVSDALRLGIESKVNGQTGRKVTLSKTGTDVKGYGTLDLNNNGVVDRAHGYSWQNRETIIYGLGDQYVTVVATDIIKSGSNYINANNFSAATIATYADLDARKTADEAEAPTNGALCYVTSLDTYFKFNAGSWQVFEDVKVSETGVVKKGENFYKVADGTAATVPATQVVFEGDYLKNTVDAADKYCVVGASSFDSVTFNAFEGTHAYSIGDLITNATKFYKATKAHTSAATFDENEAKNWEVITPIDVTGKQVKFGDKIYSYSGTAYAEVDLVKAENIIKSKSVANFISHETTVGVFDDENGLLGTTTTNNLDVNLKIYLEGWDLLGGSDATWNSNTIGAQFNLGITFATTLHDDSHN